MLVSDDADARAFRHEPTKVVSVLAGMVINSAEMVTRHETDKGHLEYRKDHRRATLRLSAYSVRAAEDCALPSGCYAAAIHLVVKSYGEIGKKMGSPDKPWG